MRILRLAHGLAGTRQELDRARMVSHGRREKLPNVRIHLPIVVVGKSITESRNGCQRSLEVRAADLFIFFGSFGPALRHFLDVCRLTLRHNRQHAVEHTLRLVLRKIEFLRKRLELIHDAGVEFNSFRRFEVLVGFWSPFRRLFTLGLLTVTF